MDIEPPSPMNDSEMIWCRVQRALVERGDSEWIALQFDSDRMSAAQLMAWHGQVAWCFDGFDEDQNELYAIPTVRRFLSEWRQHRPNWLFFGSLVNDNLRVMYVALLKDVTALRRNSFGKCEVSFDRQELGRLLADDLEIADRIAERIGVSPAQRLQRARMVQGYFGFG